VLNENSEAVIKKRKNRSTMTTALHGTEVLWLGVRPSGDNIIQLVTLDQLNRRTWN